MFNNQLSGGEPKNILRLCSLTAVPKFDPVLLSVFLPNLGSSSFGDICTSLNSLLRLVPASIG